MSRIPDDGVLSFGLSHKTVDGGTRVFVRRGSWPLAATTGNLFRCGYERLPPLPHPLPGFSSTTPSTTVSSVELLNCLLPNLFTVITRCPTVFLRRMVFHWLACEAATGSEKICAHMEGWEAKVRNKCAVCGSWTGRWTCRRREEEVVEERGRD